MPLHTLDNIEPGFFKKFEAFSRRSSQKWLYQIRFRASLLRAPSVRMTCALNKLCDTMPIGTTALAGSGAAVLRLDATLTWVLPTQWLRVSKCLLFIPCSSGLRKRKSVPRS